MSAAASAEMIETPPVLNFEEIDYKEIEVEEVSEGPAVPRTPLLPGSGQRGSRRPDPERPRGSPPRRRPSAAEGTADASRVPRDAGTPPSVPGRGFCAPVDAAAAGTSEQRQSGWERRCRLTSAGPAAGCFTVEFYLNGIDLFGMLKFRRPFCHPL